ncbi:hypothetical protein OPV22_012178 [Ensete ventricosum]|uniref:Uncharacterized protein n=1 Tax=Ensete ventricosum TaxID=4639 RepID=A0AAV8R2I6_ENSVE|nr:hypothetical protein OPV22_012178 [Ensete ventricosum]
MRRGFEFHMNWLLEGLQYALGRTTLGSLPPPPPPPPPPLSLREDHDEGEAGGALSEDFLSAKLMTFSGMCRSFKIPLVMIRLHRPPALAFLRSGPVAILAPLCFSAMNK